MMNANDAIPLAQELLNAIAREYNWPDYLPPERVLAKVDPAVYQKYAGLYELDDGFKVTMTAAEGRLWAQGQGQSKFELLPESETKYFSDIGIVHRFELGEGGGDLDLVLAKGRHWPLHDRVLLNDGQGGFNSGLPLGEKRSSRLMPSRWAT
jgi:hypothetical protein